MKKIKRAGKRLLFGNRRGPGFTLLVVSAGLTVIGGFLTDWNRPSFFKRRRKQQRKIQEVTGTSLAAFLGGGGLYLLTKKTGNKKLQLQAGTLLPASFWTLMLLFFAVFRAENQEFSFPEKPPASDSVWLNEVPAASMMLLILALGYYLERKNAEDPYNLDALKAIQLAHFRINKRF